MEYHFIRICDDEKTVKITGDLEEFKEFCHYSSLSHWGKHKSLIKKCLKENGYYAFTGNDVKYYILKGEN